MIVKMDGNGWQVVKLDAAIGSRLGYFGRFRDFNSSDFIMNTAGARCLTPAAACSAAYLQTRRR